MGTVKDVSVSINFDCTGKEQQMHDGIGIAAINADDFLMHSFASIFTALVRFLCRR